MDVGLKDSTIIWKTGWYVENNRANREFTQNYLALEDLQGTLMTHREAAVALNQTYTYDSLNGTLGYQKKICHFVSLFNYFSRLFIHV